MSWRSVALLAVGAALIVVGALWLLQGADAVHMRPILCVSNCKTVTGGSTGWLIAEIVTIVIGALAILRGTRHRHPA